MEDVLSDRERSTGSGRAAADPLPPLPLTAPAPTLLVDVVKVPALKLDMEGEPKLEPARSPVA
jgi:hypothetical protein